MDLSKEMTQLINMLVPMIKWNINANEADKQEMLEILTDIRYSITKKKYLGEEEA